MILSVLGVLISAGVLTGNYFYVKAQEGGPTKKSLLLKMLCATGYIAVAVIGTALTKEVSAFDKAMFLAFILSWLGDLFLHLKGSIIFFPIGFAGFLFSHVCFIRAYMKGISLYNPDCSFWSIPLIIFILIMLIVFTVTVYKTDMKMLRGPLIIPVMIYAATIVTMFWKASQLGYFAFKGGLSPAVFVCASLGALLFVASDFSISILIFNKSQKKNMKLKFFNMYTYFGAQLLLASLTYFI